MSAKLLEWFFLKKNIIIIIIIGFGGNAFVAETEDLNLSHKHRK